MQRSTLASILFTLLLVALLALILNQTELSATPPSPAPTPMDSGWDALLQSQPVPHLKPLPESVSGPFDGTYAKLVSAPPQWWKCYRCADYRVSGGIWKLQFDQGVMRIYYDATGWHSLGSFTISGDQVSIFNDPWCPDEEGQYTWQLRDGSLQLTPIEDGCAFELRAATLSEQPWQACTPEADTPGCQGNFTLPDPISPSDRAVTVTVHGGDGRFFNVPPDVIAVANPSGSLARDGITITFSPESVSFGLTRVLWWGGNWIEATTDLPFTAMGVQFLGESQIGWARVLFDGMEVWNGNTADIAYQNYRHGGYVEISGFAPGQHTLRAESLGFDYRPVTVAGFGFSEQGGVQCGGGRCK
ncbi:MAG TPA: hypothetical protein VI451_13005 [Anaerolineales bacterium]|nr:hypothetical protein [Anaerolineales bacterium]